MVSIAKWKWYLLAVWRRDLKRRTKINGIDMSNIDAEYEALCAEELALV